MYFEFNPPAVLEGKAVNPAMAKQYRQMVKRVQSRMDKLEKAWEFCENDPIFSMTAEQFAATAKKIFDMSAVKFDTLGWQEIATSVRTLFDGEPVEPRLEFENAIVIVDAAFITVKEWELFRHIGIGGSDSAVVRGTSPYNTQRHLYHDKVGTPVKMPDTDKNPQFERGHILEPKVIEAFAAAKGAKVIQETRMFQSMSYPHCIADVDAIVQMPNGDYYIFEAKSTVEGNKANWLRGGNGVPMHYITQCRHYPAVLDDPRIKGTYIGCLFVKDYDVAGEYVGSVYDTRDFLSRLIERDPSAEQEILADSERFFCENVLRGVEPPLNPFLIAATENGYKGTELADMKLARSLNGAADKELPPMEITDADIISKVNAYLEIQAQKSAYQKKVDELDKAQGPLKAELSTLLGQNTRAIIDVDDKTFIEVKYTPKCGKSVKYDELSIKYPDAYAECVIETPEKSRVFSVSVKDKEKEAKKAARGRKK